MLNCEKEERKEERKKGLCGLWYCFYISPTSSTPQMRIIRQNFVNDRNRNYYND